MPSVSRVMVKAVTSHWTPPGSPNVSPTGSATETLDGSPATSGIEGTSDERLHAIAPSTSAIGRATDVRESISAVRIGEYSVKNILPTQ